MLADKIVVELLPEDWEAAMAEQYGTTYKCLVAKGINRVTGMECCVGYEHVTFDKGDIYNLNKEAETIIKYFDNAHFKTAIGDFNTPMKLGTIILTRN